MERRKFNKSLGIFSFATLMGCKTTKCANKNNVNPNLSSESSDNHSRYQISLAQWSCHRMLQNGQLDNLGFAGFALVMNSALYFIHERAWNRVDQGKVSKE